MLLRTRLATADSRLSTTLNKLEVLGLRLFLRDRPYRSKMRSDLTEVVQDLAQELRCNRLKGADDPFALPGWTHLSQRLDTSGIPEPPLRTELPWARAKEAGASPRAPSSPRVPAPRVATPRATPKCIKSARCAD